MNNYNIEPKMPAGFDLGLWNAGLSLLRECGCDYNCYQKSSIESAIYDATCCDKDLSPYSAVAMGYALKAIGDACPLALPAKPAPYRVVWDADSFCDGADMDSFEAAKSNALDTLAEWAANFWMYELSDEDKSSREALCDAWNTLYYNNDCYVQELREDWETCDEDDMYVDIEDAITCEDLALIGWEEREPDDDYITEVIQALGLDIE